MATDQRTVHDAVASGRSALLEGDWTRARECFELALELDESGDVLEGLGWAGWWLADAELTAERAGACLSRVSQCR